MELLTDQKMLHPLWRDGAPARGEQQRLTKLKEEAGLDQDAGHVSSIEKCT